MRSEEKKKKKTEKLEPLVSVQKLKKDIPKLDIADRERRLNSVYAMGNWFTSIGMKEYADGKAVATPEVKPYLAQLSIFWVGGTP